MSTYSYSRRVHAQTLFNEIVASTISPTLQGISLNSDSSIGIVFDVELSANEHATLDALVANHQAQPLPLETTNVESSVAFGHPGKVNNTWLKTAGGSLQSSNSQPHVWINSGVISGLIYTNANDSTDVDIQLYKNGVLMYEWNVRDKRYAYKTNELNSYLFEAGDALSVLARKAGSNTPNWMLLTVQFRYLQTTTGEGGAATL